MFRIAFVPIPGFTNSTVIDVGHSDYTLRFHVNSLSGSYAVVVYRFGSQASTGQISINNGGGVNLYDAASLTVGPGITYAADFVLVLSGTSATLTVTGHGSTSGTLTGTFTGTKVGVSNSNGTVVSLGSMSAKSG